MKPSVIALIVAIALIFTGGILLLLGLSFTKGEENITQNNDSFMQTTEYILSDSFENILIDTADCDVDLVLMENADDPYVVIMERNRVHHNVQVENGTLKIKMADTRNWRDHVGVLQQSMSMTLFLTQEQYLSVQISTDTGYIQIPDVLKIREASLLSDTGDIDCAAYVTDQMECHTSTGKITVEYAEPIAMTLKSDTGDIYVHDAVSTTLHLENDTGRTHLENVFCKQLSSESTTGDVKIQNVLVEEYMQVSTDTGDVLIENSDAGAVNIATDTGDVSGNFLTSKWFIAESDTGDIDVPLSRDGGECRIETDTGDIQFF